MKKFTIKRNASYAVNCKNGITPVSISYSLFKDNVTKFSDDSLEKSSCLNCINQPCIDYASDEIRTSVLPEMPFNSSTKVCPVDALAISSNGFPSVDEKSCIGCGICLSRCNYGAINLNKNNVAVIETGFSEKFEWAESLTETEFTRREKTFKKIPIQIKTELLEAKYLTALYKNISIRNANEIGFENLIVRNLFLNLGVKCKIRAVGNNDIRFDMIGEFGAKILLCEIGLNNTDILEEPRAILDDFAILNSRYKIEKKRIVPIMITLIFPNKRSDVYEVIYDIKNILGYEIKTISAHLLIIMNLLRLKIDAEDFFASFFVNKDKKSIKEDAILLIPKLNLIDPFLESEYYYAVK
jgi:NAD-dependent dihydropyrimidine dehydrogenase PreA subunit